MREANQVQDRVLLSSTDFDFFIDSLERTPHAALDTETTTDDLRDGRGYCLGSSLSFPHNTELQRGRMSTYLPFRHALGDNYSPVHLAKLKQVIEGKELLIFHHARHDLFSLRTLGINYTGRFYDTLLMAHWINENWPSKALDWLTQNVVGGEGKLREPAFKDFIKKFGWNALPSNLAFEYAVHDADMTLDAFDFFLPMFKEQGFDGELWNTEQEWVRLIMKMESHGVRIDQPLCEKQITIGQQRMTEIVEKLGGLNPSSNLDLERLLLLELSLPVMKYTPGGKPSFDKIAMAAYELLLSDLGDNETASNILEYRGWQKTTSANYKSYMNLLSPDGRLRPNFKVHGTTTGRLSCEKPALQQIPRVSDKPWNGKLHDAFIPQVGFGLWELDYSQLELRLAAAYAKEKRLLDIFNSDDGRDIFSEMAKDLGFTRHDTKTLTYMILYTAGVDKIAKVFRVSNTKAKEIRSNFYRTYPGFQKMTNMASAVAARQHFIKFWTGRRRHFDRKEDAYKAFNAAIQGGAFEIVKRRMLAVDKEMPDLRMLMQIHDSIVVEIPVGQEDMVLPKIQSIMEDITTEFGVKFKVDIKRWGGESWQSNASTNLIQHNAPSVAATTS